MGAGEFKVMVNSYFQDAIKAKRKGSPVDWLALDPVVAGAGSVSINSQAPNPNAARLFVDFILSKEGQELIVRSDRSSVRKDVSGNPLDLIKGVRTVPSDINLAKNYLQIRDEFRSLLDIK